MGALSLKLSILLFLGLFLIQPLAVASECLNQSDLTFLKSKFKIQQWDKDWITIESVELCDSKNILNKTLSALVDLKNLPPLASHPDLFDQGVIKNSPFEFVFQRVQTIRFDTNPKSTHCRSNVSGTLAYVLDSSSGEIHICPFISNFNSLQILGTIVHEARHLWEKDLAETKGKAKAFTHSICERGFFKNTYSCDTSIEVSGSYGVEMEFYLKLARTKSLDLTIRRQAHGILVDGYIGHFNQLPGGQDGMLLQADNGSLFFYNDKEETFFELLKGIPAESIVTDRFTPNFFDTQQGTAKSYVGSNLFADTRGVIAEDFRKFDLKKMSQLRDVIYGLSHQCMLFEESLRCSDGDFDINFKLPSSIKAKQLSILRIVDRDLIFIVSDKGKHYMLPTEKPINEWNLEALEETTSLSDFLSVALMPKLKRYGISMDGTFVNYTDPSDRKAVKIFEGISFKKIMGPFFWSREIENLAIDY